MSIPLVQNNEKDSINTSIIAIKRQIERINALLGLSNSEEIDTSVFATKDELQQAVTDLQPVDEVTADNMQSVTSNAVAARFDKFDYSENEVNTGRKWIDGKPIYTKVVNIGNASIGTNNSYNHNISNLGTVISLTRHFIYNNNHYMFWDGNLTWTVTSSKINISGVTSLSVTQLFFIIEYTKTTD